MSTPYTKNLETKMAAKNKRGFEELLKELEDIVTSLESGEVPLEVAISNYEKGIELLKECYKRLNAAENKLKVILKDSEKELRLADCTPATLKDLENAE